MANDLQTLASTNFDYQNFFSGALTADITDSDTDIFIDTIPTPSEGTLVIDWDVPAKREVIFYTSKTASKVTTHANGRGFDSTTAVAHSTGAKVIMAPVGEWFRYIQYLATTSPAGWRPLGDTPDTITYNGNRSYDLVYNSVDLSDTISAGMRKRFTRTVSAPDQCADLEASSSQYFSRASGSLTGITFTDDFTVMAWIKLESYGDYEIISRYATNGWLFRVTNKGELQLSGKSTTTDVVKSSQSLPLNRWVHVAGSLDMSGATGALYIDGVLVHSTYTNATATSITQDGNLNIGAYGGGTNPFDGKIAQVGLFDAVLSASTIRSYSSQTLTGSETNNIGAWTLDNDLTDLNANGNDLTANGGALATSSDSPFGNYLGLTTDYGIITKVSFSTNTTVTVQVPEGCTIPTTGGISSVDYSTDSSPFGFVRDKGRWTIFIPSKTEAALGTGSSMVNSSNLYTTIPIGAWKLSYKFIADYERNGGSTTTMQGALSETISDSAYYVDSVSAFAAFDNSAPFQAVSTMSGFTHRKYDSAQTIYMLDGGLHTSGNFYISIGGAGNTNSHHIKAELDYL